MTPLNKLNITSAQVKTACNYEFHYNRLRHKFDMTECNTKSEVKLRIPNHSDRGAGEEAVMGINKQEQLLIAVRRYTRGNWKVIVIDSKGEVVDEFPSVASVTKMLSAFQNVDTYYVVKTAVVSLEAQSDREQKRSVPDVSSGLIETAVRYVESKLETVNEIIKQKLITCVNEGDYDTLRDLSYRMEDTMWDHYRRAAGRGYGLNFERILSQESSVEDVRKMAIEMVKDVIKNIHNSEK